MVDDKLKLGTRAHVFRPPISRSVLSSSEFMESLERRLQRGMHRK